MHQKHSLNIGQSLALLFAILMPSRFGKPTRAPTNVTRHVVVRGAVPGVARNKSRFSVGWALTLTGGVSLLCVASIVLGAFALAFTNPALYARIYRQAPPLAQPILDPLKATSTPMPDAVLGGGQDEQGQSLDSQCPVGAPTISVRGGPTVVGKSAWFDSLPKEPEEGTAICVITREYQAFLKASGTFNGGLLNGKRLSGLEVLAYHYSYESVGSDARLEELKAALGVLVPASYQGAPLKDTAWVTLPGFVKRQTTPPQPICPNGNCYEPTPAPTPSATPTAFQPLNQATATLTPLPTSVFTPTPVFADMVTVPTLIVVTKQPAVATAMSNLSVDDWMALHESARVYNGEHCQHIYTVDIRELSSHELWAYTDPLTFKNGQLGWIMEGNRRDVFVPGYGNYPVYSVCGQVLGMPSTQNIDGNGTVWNGGIGKYYPPAAPDPTTGLVQVGSTYYVNVYGVWLGPAFPKAPAFAPTATPTPTATPKPVIGTLPVMQAIELGSGGGYFTSWTVVNAADKPTAANPKVLMTSIEGSYWIDFTGYVTHVRPSSQMLMLANCGSPVASTAGSYKLKDSNIVTSGWCIIPGQ